MLAFLAMLFTLRIGLGGAPVSGAVASLRAESLTVAAQTTAQASRPPVAVPVLEQRWEPPPRRQLTERDWRNMFADALQSESIANAVMWLATQPLHVSVGSEKILVTVRVATP